MIKKLKEKSFTCNNHQEERRRNMAQEQKSTKFKTKLWIWHNENETVENLKEKNQTEL